MAPSGDAEARPEDDAAHRVQRDYEDGHPARHREPAPGGHEPRQRAAGTPRARPPGGLRDKPHPVEQDQARAERRPRAERGGAPDSGARGGDQELRQQALLPRDGGVPPAGEQQDPQRRAEPPLRHRRGGRGLPPQHRGRQLQDYEDRDQARTPHAGAAVHHQHPAAGGQPQAGLQRGAHHAGGAAALRERIYHLHAYRQREPQRAGPGHGEEGDREPVRPRIRQDPPLPDQDQRSPRGPRSHTPHQPRGADHQHRERTAPPLRAHLEAHRGQPDGRRRDGEDRDRDHHKQLEPHLRLHRRAGEVRRLPEGVHGRHRRRGRRPDTVAAAQAARRHHADHGMLRGRRALHAAPAALHRGQPRQEAGRPRHRPPVDLRAHHQHHPQARVYHQGRPRGRDAPVHDADAEGQRREEGRTHREGLRRQGQALPHRHRMRGQQLPDGPLHQHHGLQLHGHGGEGLRRHRRRQEGVAQGDRQVLRAVPQEHTPDAAEQPAQHRQPPAGRGPRQRQERVRQDRPLRHPGADRRDQQRREAALRQHEEGAEHRDHHPRRRPRALLAAAHPRPVRGQGRDGEHRQIRPLRAPQRQVLLAGQERRPV